MNAKTFNFTFPFQTRCGWPARLLGVVRHDTFPYVVAVFNPALGYDQVYHYNAEGVPGLPGYPSQTQWGDLKPVYDSMLTLVSLSDDAYYAVKPETQVHAHVKELPPFSPNCNSMQHDHWRMGTPLVRGWIALHEGFGRPGDVDPLRNVILVNEKTGQRFQVNFTPVHAIEAATKVVLSVTDDADGDGDGESEDDN